MMKELKRTHITALLVIGFIVIMLVGFGGTCSKKSSDNDVVASSSPAPIVAVVGEAVDPYIVGARFFEDVDNNGVKDTGEQLSSISDSNGVFTFANALQVGSTILMDPAITPTHVGINYTGEIKRKIGAGETTGSLIASPLTTLLANGWTEQNVIDVLIAAGLTGITTTDLTLSPMSVIENYNSSTLNASHLIKIKSSIAIYSFLSIMEGLSITGYNVTYIDFINYTSGTVTSQQLLTKMVNGISTALSPTLLANIQTQMTTANSSLPSGVPPLPELTAADIINPSVAIANYIIPKVIANVEYQPNITQLGTLAGELGKRFYCLRNKTNPTIIAGMTTYFGLTGLFDVRPYTTFYINDSGTIVNVP